ncbi:uncharacterized protein LOC128682483 [Plodia interpunctella]|uniref:uncharacterized protein LOC128682483 n=1 Tax=Plodia interpunctella TaxID=58824 RepID=UPI002367C7C6|nr:uncharacterized protein LOC128682483 [Plodia interpunctella]
MEANNFVARLKANGTENDLCDLTKVIDEHKVILSKLPSKDKGSFCLNVLCILCRNIDKVPTWSDNTDPRLLLSLSIDCVRETQGMTRTDQVKILACIYHIHRYIVKLRTPIPPKLVLQLSSMALQCEELLAEYAKTYWSILADRIGYIEMLKDGNISIIKLLPKLTEDVLKVIQIYDSTQFCINILSFLLKKLHFLYSDLHSVELNQVYGQIFYCLKTKNDLKNFKKLSAKDVLDLYVKFNDCFYVIVKNSSRHFFKESVLSSAVSTCINILAHNSDMTKCFQTFYLNAFCVIFKNIDCDIDAAFSNLSQSFETMNINTKIIYASYPFVNQLLRLYIDYIVANVEDWTSIFKGNNIMENCLKIIFLLMKKSKHCEQLLKCELCKVKTGLHDAIRLSFLSIHLVKLTDNIGNILPIFTNIIEEQHAILKDLKILGCYNHDKCYRKLQTDIHNTAIVLNKLKHYEYSINLFNIYLEYEIKNFKDNSELKNISRALYNKSICELDFRRYEDALKNAFLSLVFAYPDGLDTDKYMSLVMDIKAKALKCDDDECRDSLQSLSVLDACKVCLEEKRYGHLRPFYVPVKFSLLLQHELSLYCKLWPSLVPLSGALRALWLLGRGGYAAVCSAENEDLIMATLYDMILKTSATVRTIHNDCYKSVICDVISMFDETPASSTELQLTQAAMFFLKAELDLYDASEKYGWKNTEPNTDPDEVTVRRTLSQEHEASTRAIQAVDIMTDVLPYIARVPVTDRLKLVLELANIFVYQLLHLCRQCHALQLAYVCCELAKHVGDLQTYMRCAGVVISHADKQTDKQTITDMVTAVWAAAGDNPDFTDAALGFLCDVAIYKIRAGAVGAAARLIRIVQTKIQESTDRRPNVNLDLSWGRLLEAQSRLCAGDLSAVNYAQRHYMAVNNMESRRHARRSASAALSGRSAETCAAAVRCALSLCLYRRARAWRGGRAAAPRLAELYAHAHDLTWVKIDNRLKYILGMQTNESCQISNKKDDIPQAFTPKPDIELMLDNMTFKKSQISPSMPCLPITRFQTPNFLKHTKCDCYACAIPQCYILAAFTIGLEAIMYFRTNETDIARNYFEGAFKCFHLAEEKLRSFNVNCEKFIFDAVKRGFVETLKRYEVELLIEAGYFELSLNNYERADVIVVQIHDILNEYDIDSYLRNDVLNLMVCSAETRRHVNRNVESSLEAEFESLKLPANMEPPKTPEIKPKAPPKIPKVTVNDEELPKKRKVIKLNLDEVADTGERETKKKIDFKIPTPATKRALEIMTPRNTSSIPNISVTKDDIFHTPLASTSEEFFTPMSSLKTYAGKSLRQNIVKNLEVEFSTPKGVEKGGKGGDLMSEKSRVKIKDNKRTLKRATSPGKLVKVTPNSVRTTRRTQNPN